MTLTALAAAAALFATNAQQQAHHVQTQQAKQARQAVHARHVKSAAKKLSSGEHSKAVWHLQQQLQKLSYLNTRQVDGSYGYATEQAVMAFQKYERLARDGVAGPATQRRLRHAHRPRPQGKGDRNRIEILRGRQVALLVHNNRVWRTIPVSTGMPGHTTPLGSWHVYRKEPNSYSLQYHAPMPWSSYYVGGYALHESAEVPAYPASHGCSRVPQPFIQTVYRFAVMGRQVNVLDR